MGRFVCLQSLLPQEEAVVFVVSTTGQGDTPDSMKVNASFKPFFYVLLCDV